MKRMSPKPKMYYTDQTLGGRKRLIPLSRKYIVDALSVHRMDLLHKYNPLPSVNEELSLKQGFPGTDVFSEKDDSPRKRELAARENFTAKDCSSSNEVERLLTENSSATSSKTLICNRCKQERNQKLVILARQRCVESRRIQTEIPVVVRSQGAKTNAVIKAIEDCNKTETPDIITKEKKYGLCTIPEKE